MTDPVRAALAAATKAMNDECLHYAQYGEQPPQHLLDAADAARAALAAPPPAAPAEEPVACSDGMACVMSPGDCSRRGYCLMDAHLPEPAQAAPMGCALCGSSRGIIAEFDRWRIAQNEPAQAAPDEPLSDDAIMGLMRKHLFPSQIRTLSTTQWKDGIDIEVPFGGLRTLLTDSLARLRAERDEAQRSGVTHANYWKDRAERAEAALAAARADADRIDWLDKHPREATIRVEGDMKACVFYGVSCDPKWSVREAIDAARAAT
jgi:hypothetical protein